MSFPYWRLYWNRSGKARVVYNRTIYLKPGKLVLIPPNTPFSTDIDDTTVHPDQPYSLRGGRIESRDMEEELTAGETVLHMFIHFTLGYPYDAIRPDVFEFDITPFQQELIKSITGQLIAGQLKFQQMGSLELYALLFSVLHRLPENTWSSKKLDPRVVSTIHHMEKHIREIEISNQTLARLGGMSVNAWARLFREQTGHPPRKYLIKMRIEKACNLLHHSDLSIEQIASDCGFSDRYYFTRIFTRTMKVSPGVYRKSSGLTRDQHI